MQAVEDTCTSRQDVATPHLDGQAEKVMTGDKPLRWLPDMGSNHRRQSLNSIPRFPLRQASFYTYSDAGSRLSRTSSGTCSILSDCEQLSIDIHEMLKDLHGESGESCESAQAEVAAPSRCSTDRQSIKSASLPRRPCRNPSFGTGDKRWSGGTDEESFKSFPGAVTGGKTPVSTTRRSLPQMPRRQKSDV